ncbi:MAG: hypothetical protein R2828_10765 [Saprospiraceae bacterium]
MIPQTLQKKVSNLIAQGKTKEAIMVLGNSRSVKNDAQLGKYLTLIAAQFKHYKINEVTNTQLSSFQQKTLNQINNALLSLVNGDLDELASLKLEAPPAMADPVHTNSTNYILLSILVVAIVAFGYYFVTKPTPNPAINSPIITEKPVKIKYKLTPLNEQGQATDMFIVKIYEDYTGEFISNGRPLKITKVFDADDVSLKFQIESKGSIFSYESLLPSLDDINKGYRSINGQLIVDNLYNGRWLAVVD